MRPKWLEARFVASGLLHRRWNESPNVASPGRILMAETLKVAEADWATIMVTKTSRDHRRRREMTENDEDHDA